MVIETLSKKDDSEGENQAGQLTVLYENDFLAEDGEGKPKPYSINFFRDSYIISVTGPRGSGKNIFMTYMGTKMLAAGMRVISNYQISFLLIDRHGTSTVCKSEPLDLYKLLCFDNEYKGCLILLDEAPTIVSQLSSMSWKNRLLNIFLQQIRKNGNSLIYAAQNPHWVDFGLRWQTDIEMRCRDASKRYASHPTCGRGEVVLLDMIDVSGNFSGYSYDERPRTWPFKIPEASHYWGCYDTLNSQDPFEALQKVDLQLSKQTIDGRTDEDKARSKDTSHLDKAKELLIKALDDGQEKTSSTAFYREIGDVTQSQKFQIGRFLTTCGVERRRGSNGEIVLKLANVDRGQLER